VVSETIRRQWAFRNVRFDERTLQLTVGGVAVTTEPKPLELLMYLLRHSGEVVTRQEIFAALWPGRVVSDGVITNCVGKLRAALGDEDQTLIRTVPRYGYQLTGEIQVLPDDGAPAAPEVLGLKPGQPVPGRPQFKLVRPLAAGGQAEVWLAERPEAQGEGEGERTLHVFKFARDVAELAALRREVTLNRLLAENPRGGAQVLPLRGCNLETPPFFVETPFIAGGNLAAWCEQRGGPSAVPLSVRLDLMVQCAQAVADAHSAGVLHKDIKPENILIDDCSGAPRVQLCDFGAGAVIDRGLLDQLNIPQMGFTRTVLNASEAGTTRYLAPELLLDQRPTVQSDVFALGVLLFQLVTGDFHQVLAPGWELKVEDPLLREDIAAAAHGDPRHRLSDASQLASRLAGLPMRRQAQQQRAAAEAQAARDRLSLERARARRSLWVALSATLAVGLTLIGLLYAQARQARDVARDEADTSAAVVQFLTDDLLAFANPRVYGNGDARIRDLLEAADKNLATRFADRPLVRARVQRTIGSAFGALGLIDPAVAHLKPAIETLAAERGDADAETQMARIALRDSYRIAHRFAEVLPVGTAIRHAEEAAEQRESALWFEGAWSEHYGRCQIEARSLWFEDCGRRLQPLLDEARRVLGDDHPVTVRLMWIRATLSQLVEPAESVEPLLAEAHERMSRQLPAGHPRLLEVQMHWAMSMAERDPARAEAMLREATVQLLRTMGEDHDFVAMARFFLGRVLARQGRWAEAEPLFSQTWAWRQRRIGLDSIVTANALAALVQAQQHLGRPDAALALAESAHRRLLAQTGGDPAVRLRYAVTLAQALEGDRHHRRRGEVLEAAAREARTLLTRGQWYLGYVLSLQGQWLLQDGQRAAAAERLQEAVALLEPSRGPTDRYTREAATALQRASR